MVLFGVFFVAYYQYSSSQYVTRCSGGTNLSEPTSGPRCRVSIDRSSQWWVMLCNPSILHDLPVSLLFWMVQSAALTGV